MENIINSFGTSCYRIMLDIRRIDRVPNATIYSLTETAPLIETVRLRQLRFLGHVLGLPENEPVREFAMYVSTHGRRKPGRQRTLFTNYIHCLLGDPDSLLNDNQMLEMIQDRHRWRKTVVDCSAAELDLQSGSLCWMDHCWYKSVSLPLPLGNVVKRF